MCHRVVREACHHAEGEEDERRDVEGWTTLQNKDNDGEDGEDGDGEENDLEGVGEGGCRTLRLRCDGRRFCGTGAKRLAVVRHGDLLHRLAIPCDGKCEGERGVRVLRNEAADDGDDGFVGGALVVLCRVHGVPLGVPEGEGDGVWRRGRSHEVRAREYGVLLTLCERVTAHRGKAYRVVVSCGGVRHGGWREVGTTAVRESDVHVPRAEVVGRENAGYVLPVFSRDEESDAVRARGECGDGPRVRELVRAVCIEAHTLLNDLRVHECVLRDGDVVGTVNDLQHLRVDGGVHDGVRILVDERSPRRDGVADVRGILRFRKCDGEAVGV